MAQQPQQPVLIPVTEDFPPPTMPTVFADGVTSLLPTPFVVKFFLGRVEPDLQGRPSNKVQPFAQVVMATPGFLQTAFFFQNAVNNMIAQGIVTQQQIDEAKALAAGPAHE